MIDPKNRLLPYLLAVECDMPPLQRRTIIRAADAVSLLAEIRADLWGSNLLGRDAVAAINAIDIAVRALIPLVDLSGKEPADA